MIITKIVSVHITDRNAKHYENKGYVVERVQGFKSMVVKQNQLIEVKVEDLPKGSKALVSVKCDYCGFVNESKYYKDVLRCRKDIEKDACKKCTKSKEFDIHGNAINDIRSNTCRTKNNNTHKHAIEIIESFGFDVLSEIPKCFDNDFDYIIKCNKHDHIFTRKHKTIISKKFVQCRMCLNEQLRKDGKITRLKTHEEFLSEMNNIHPNINVLGKYDGNKTKIECMCIDCNNIWKPIPNDLTSKGSGCPACNETNNKKENILYEYLTKFYNVERQVKFDGLVGIGGHRLSYDFFICVNGRNILIERQGEGHVKPISRFGGEKQFIKQQEHDRRKREYAENNGYELIEVWYYEDYKEKLESCGLCIRDSFCI